VRAPLVAIAGYHLDPGRVTRWRQGAYAVPDAYVDAIRRAGGLPAVIYPPDVDLDRTDALLMVGGGDIDPAAYGGAPHDKVYGVDTQRDVDEISLLRGALDRGLPVLAVCRGIQIANVAFGGTLHAHVPDLPGAGSHGVPGGEPGLHDVKLEPDSAVALACGGDIARASCHHHQSVDEVGTGLVVTGRASDGVVEALELADQARSWLVAVQWHPEDTAADDPAQQGLFDTLVAQARTGT
jgi:putative glutamine amidotransferase